MNDNNECVAMDTRQNFFHHRMQSAVISRRVIGRVVFAFEYCSILPFALHFEFIGVDGKNAAFNKWAQSEHSNAPQLQKPMKTNFR